MAISVLQRPSSGLETFPAYDPCIYVVKESSIGAYKFSYTCEIEHWNGSAYVAIATLRIPKNSSDAGVFEVGEIVRSYFISDPPILGTSLIEDTASGSRFKFIFGSEQALTSTGAPVANASTTTETDVDFYSGQGRTDTAGYNQGDSTRFDLYLNTSNNRMLTTSGWPEMNPRYKVRANDRGSIDFLYQQRSLGAADTVRLTYYNGSSQLSQTDITLAPYASGSRPADCVMRFWCYPFYLENLGSGNVQPSANAGWTHYTIQFRYASLSASVIHKFVLVDECSPQELKWTWLNQFGGWEHMVTTGNWQVVTTYTDKQYESIRGNWFDAGGSLFSYSTYERGVSRIVGDTSRVYTINTGLLYVEDNARVESLLRSRSVYVTNPEGSSATAQFPCVINARSLRRFESFHPDVREYSFEMSLSNGPKAQVL